MTRPTIGLLVIFALPHGAARRRRAAAEKGLAHRRPSQLPSASRSTQVFKERLQELGYVEGQNLALEVRTRRAGRAAPGPCR